MYITQYDSHAQIHGPRGVNMVVADGQAPHMAPGYLWPVPHTIGISHSDETVLLSLTLFSVNYQCPHSITWIHF